METKNQPQSSIKKKWHQSLWIKITTFTGGVILIAQLTDGLIIIKGVLPDFKKEIEIVDPHITYLSKIIDSDRTKVIEADENIIFDKSNESFLHPNLVDYYIDLNKEIFNFIYTNTQRNKSSITYLIAPAGSGKSFLMNRFDANHYKVTMLDLARIVDRSNLNPIFFTLEPDLTTSNSDNKYTFNEMPNLKPEVAHDFDFSKLLSFANYNINNTDSRPQLILIDGLDEVHPNLSKRVLEITHTYINNSSLPLQAIIAGRPEGFRPFLTSRFRSTTPKYITRTHILQTPILKTKGDLRIAIKNYNDYTEGEKIDELSTLENIINTLEDDPLFPYYSGNLSILTFIIQECSKNKYSINDLHKRILSNILARNNKKMGRPNYDDEIYYNLIKASIIKYKNKVDSIGYFEVSPNDEVTVVQNLTSGPRRFTVKVTSLLNRSGIIFLNPISLESTKYKFEPYWIINQFD
ncbi:ATP-binding protein [Rufibacter psychrotolerans]|uniref:ATP-binding protein n=1 Tax=Rufibacter psychrotolerans TaxID=2812556 RepID=UPI00196796B0|nr:ATP-binding protein [Rufibacter sp. SYSU D00308]